MDSCDFIFGFAGAAGAFSGSGRPGLQRAGCEAVQYESLSIILQRRAIAYWWGRIQYATGRIQ